MLWLAGARPAGPDAVTADGDHRQHRQGRHEQGEDEAADQLLRNSATRKARSSDCRAFSRGSHVVV